MKTDIKACIDSIRRTGCAIGYRPDIVRKAWAIVEGRK